MVSESKSPGLALSAVALVTMALLISAIAGWFNWYVTVAVSGAVVRSPTSWVAQAGIYSLGGLLAALVSYAAAVRLRYKTRSFRLASAAAGNLSVAAVALPIALIYSGFGSISLSLVLVVVVAVPALWLSLLPMRSQEPRE